MSEPIANDWQFIAARLREIRQEADTRTGLSVASPVDAAIKPPEPEPDAADDIDLTGYALY